MNKVITLGCRLNAYESEVMRSHADNAGLQDSVIINTCAVTGEAERQARQEIRRAKKKNPNAKIIVTGCAAQINPTIFAEMDEVDVVLGNDDKMSLESYKNMANNGHNLNQSDKIILTDIMEVKETASHMVGAFAEQTRAFVQVQNGCNHRCTFCIIPFGRGNSRSVPMGQVVDQVRLLVEKGYNEIVFTGVDISSYGEDLPNNPTLGNLIRRTLKLIPELKRLRISSIDAVEIDDELYKAIAEEERLMPHLHISIQAGDDIILKRMKRRHLRQDILDFCAKVKDLRPDMVFGADIIAGFPTETDEMFANTLALVEEANLVHLHVFPYSEREGTPAAKMPKVPHHIRKMRAKKLREAGNNNHQKFIKQLVGKPAQILVEKNNIGRTEQFALAKIIGNEVAAGSLLNVTLGDVKDEVLQVLHI